MHLPRGGAVEAYFCKHIDGVRLAGNPCGEGVYGSEDYIRKGLREAYPAKPSYEKRDA